MSRTGGDQTRKRILAAAEELFSNKGFIGTSVSSIAARAQVNKALIYYYFRDKGHLVFSLFESILEEFAASDRPDFSEAGNRQDPARVPAALKREVSFLEKRKNILAVMLMEALKAEDQDMALFRCAELITSRRGEKRTKLELFYEFFTGFIPLLAFVTLRDKWCEYFDSNADDALRYFVKSFVASHVETRL